MEGDQSAEETPIIELPGLGDRSVVMLRDAGITTIEQLRDLGPAFAFVAVRQRHRRVSLNLLWAMAAGLQGRHWTSLTRQEKDALRRELDDLLGT